MSRSKLVFFSDVHIGTNAPTNWYQASVHEPYLLAAFAYIRENADEIQELVLVGDLVDQWTYVPSARPPSFAEIAAANPNVFGGTANGARVTGALVEAVSALKGRVTYVNGNHDMAVTAADLAILGDAQGHVPRLAPGPYYEPEAGQGRIVCAHGHTYSMLNAPDRVHAPETGLPLAHFITRTSAIGVEEQLAGRAPGSTAADLPSSGDPSGWALDKDVLVNIAENILAKRGSLSRAVIDTLLELTGRSRVLAYRMLDGSTITAEEVIARYDGLLDAWREGARYPEELYGKAAWLFALAGVDARNRLEHFAGVLGKRHKVVVMGHTHVPEDESEHVRFLGDALYANPGFGCPSRPDMERGRPKHPTFVEVEIDEVGRRFVAGVRYVVNEGGRCRVAPEPLHPVKTISMD